MAEQGSEPNGNSWNGAVNRRATKRDLASPDIHLRISQLELALLDSQARLEYLALVLNHSQFEPRWDEIADAARKTDHEARLHFKAIIERSGYRFADNKVVAEWEFSSFPNPNPDSPSRPPPLINEPGVPKPSAILPAKRKRYSIPTASSGHSLSAIDPNLGPSLPQPKARHISQESESSDDQLTGGPAATCPRPYAESNKPNPTVATESDWAGDESPDVPEPNLCQALRGGHIQLHTPQPQQQQLPDEPESSPLADSPKSARKRRPPRDPTKPKRHRARAEEVDRRFKCLWPGCDKAYGRLPHLNTHIVDSEHGNRFSTGGYRLATAK